MAAKRIVVSYFVEDVAHDTFIDAVIKRVGKEEHISLGYASRTICHGNRVFEELRGFLRDARQYPSLPTDLLVVAVDGNSKGHTERLKEIQREIQQARYARPVVCMIPEPHIERWYLCDPHALRQALSPSIKPKALPKQRYQRDWYKTEYHRLIKEAQIPIILNEYEHAEAIVEAMDLYEAGRKEPSLGRFLDDLRSALKSVAQQA